MSWSHAFSQALLRSSATNNKYYVRAYRTHYSSRWVYGIYIDPSTPLNGR